MSRCGCSDGGVVLRPGANISVSGKGTFAEPYIISGAAAGVGFLAITPESFGALGDGIANDATALQAAIDACEAQGGGAVLLRHGARYGWSGTLTVKNAVYLIGNATRQPISDTDPPTVAGLVALNASAQLRIGDWTTASAPGGVQNLYVDGNKIGGAGTTTGLVRISGVNIYIDNLVAHRSAGDGIVYNGVQNSTVVAGVSTFHAGAALVMDNGAGAVSFQGGYFGTSHGGALDFRDTAGETNLYPFGPTQNTWDGTIFESYDVNNTPHVYHVHVSGLQNKFTNCNFTAGADNATNCAVLIDSTVSGIPSQVTFDNCMFWTKQNFDAIRVLGSSRIHVDGFIGCYDDGTNHALSFICADGGFPTISGSAVVDMAGADDGTTTFRAINSGSYAAVAQVDLGLNYRLRSNQVIGVRRQGDTANRAYIDRDGSLAWFDGVTGLPKGFITKGATGHGIDLTSDGSGPIRALGAQFQATAGISMAGSLDRPPPGYASNPGAYTMDASLGQVFRFVWYGATATTFTISNPAAGREILLEMAFAAVPTITWPTDLRFAGGAAPAMTVGTVNVLRFMYDEVYSRWVEVSRSVAVPLA